MSVYKSAESFLIVFPLFLRNAFQALFFNRFRSNLAEWLVT